MSRLVFWCVGIALAALWFRGTSPSIAPPLVAGRAYDLPVSSGATEFDLPFDRSGQSYLLVLGNLSRELTPRRMTLQATPVAHCERQPWQLWSPTICPSTSTRVQSCPTLDPQIEESAAGRQAARSPAPQRSVWLTIAGAMSHASPVYREIRAQLKASGRRVDIYVDSDDRVDAQVPPAVVAAYDRLILPVVSRHLGMPNDVDRSGALTIVLTSWLDRLEAGQVSLSGMVRPADYDPRGRAPQSNANDIVFLSAGLRPGRHLETLLAHELAHAVAAGARQTPSDWLGPAIEQPWVSEGVAHLTEDLAGRGWTNLDYRVSAFLARPELSPLVVGGDDAPRARDAGSRGNTYLFHRWCAANHGTQIVRALVAGRSCGEANVTQAVGREFDDLLRGYWLSLVSTAREHEPRSNAAALSPLDLTDRIGARALGGPYVADWNVADQDVDCSTEVAGTAAAVLRLHSTQTGVFRVRVGGPCADWQLSLCPHAAEAAPLQLTAETLPNGQVRLTLSTNSPQPLRLEHVAWDRVGGTRGSEHVEWRGDELSRWFNARELTCQEPLVSRPSRVGISTQQGCRAHAVAADDAGRRYCAWAEIHAAPRYARHFGAIRLSRGPAARGHNGL